jgi:hypothetical protein
MSVALKTPSAGTAAHTLGGVYRSLADRCEALTVRVAEPGGDRTEPGATAAELTTDQRLLDAFVDAEAARIQHRYGTVPRRYVAASRALHDYAWSLGLLMAGAWYLERRVPRIRPEDVRLDLASAAYVITPGTELSCLDGDPLGALPGVLTIPHEAALRAELRAAVAEHMGPLLTAFGSVVRRRGRALWGMVADDLVSGIWYLGRTLGQEGDAVRAATEVLPVALSPYPAGADFRYLTDRDGRRHVTRTRTGCCLHYTIRPAEACITCPRTCDTERLRRLKD